MNRVDKTIAKHSVSLFHRGFTWYVIALGLLWVAIVGFALLWTIANEKREIANTAVKQAIAWFDDDLMSRTWSNAHRAVVVAPPGGEPDPDRPVGGTEAGSDGRSSLVTRLASLNPINTDNRPDPWERLALEAFENGDEKSNMVESTWDEPRVRLMRPLFLEESCLSCHTAPDLDEGDCAGGVSISLHLGSILTISSSHLRAIRVTHGGALLIGLIGLVLVARRINAELAEKEKLESARLESENRYRGLIENSPLAILVHSEDRFVYANPKAVDLLGGSAESDIIGKSSLHFVHPESREIVIRRIEEIRKTDKSVPVIEEKYIRVDGGIIDVEVSGIRSVYKGKPAVQVVFRDLTFRKRTQASLEEARGRLQTVIENSPVVLWAIDTDGFFTLSEGDGLKYFQLEPGQIVGESIWELFAENADTLECVRKALSGAAVSADTEVVGRTWQTSYIPLRDAKGTVSGIIGISVDVTERKQIEREKETLIRELGAKNTELEQFTYTVSHDLKSPLITIKGYLGILEEDVLSGDAEKVRTDIGFISHAATRMQQLLEELLELSRIGRKTNPHEDINLGELIAEVETLLDASIRRQNVTINVQNDLPVIRGDRVRLAQVFQNLIANAMKFSSETEPCIIEIGYRPGSRDTIITVSDNGIGIKPRYHHRIFGLFEQLDPAREGTGLGLALVKRIVEAHGASIQVESGGHDGTGTVFSLIFPPRKEEKLDDGAEQPDW